jgi:hypothetical protein
VPTSFGCGLQEYQVDSAKGLAEMQQKMKAELQKATAAADAEMDELVPEATCAADMPDDMIAGFTKLADPFLCDAVDDQSKDLETLIEIEEQIAEAEQELERQEAIEVSIFKAGNEQLMNKLQEESMNKNMDKGKINLEMKIAQAISLFEISSGDLTTEVAAVVEQV